MWKKIISRKQSSLLGLYFEHQCVSAISFALSKTKKIKVLHQSIHDYNKNLNSLKNVEFPTRLIASCLPDSEIVSKQLPLDSDSSTKKIKQILVNYLKSERINSSYCFDYQTFKIKNRETLLVTSIERKKLETHCLIIEEANLIPTIVEPKSHAIERFFSFFYPHLHHHTFYLIHIDNEEITWYLISYFHTVSISSKSLKQDGNNPTDICFQTQDLYQYYYSLNSDKINYIYLIGNHSDLEKIKNKIETSLKIETHIINLSKVLSIKKKNLGFSFLVSAGLALRTR